MHLKALFVFLCTNFFSFLFAFNIKNFLLFIYRTWIAKILLSQSCYHLLIRALSASFFIIAAIYRNRHYLWSSCDNFNCGIFFTRCFYSVFYFYHATSKLITRWWVCDAGDDDKKYWFCIKNIFKKIIFYGIPKTSWTLFNYSFLSTHVRTLLWSMGKIRSDQSIEM